MAIERTLDFHQLPESDYQRVKAWARAEAIGELWALLQDALATDPAERDANQAQARRRRASTPSGQASTPPRWKRSSPFQSR